MAYSNDIFSAFSFIGFVVSILPLYWHLEAWNVGTCAYMIWSGILCLNQFINSIVWRDDAIIRARVFCDISVRVIGAGNVAIPAASLCIMRRLYRIASVRSVMVTQGDKRRAIIEDLLLTAVFPIFYTFLAFIPQGHRSDIYQEVGCQLPIYNTWVAWVLFLIWPLVLGFISAIYCVLVLRSFYKRSSQFSDFLSASSNLTIHRYMRLMALATIEMLCTVPIASWFAYINATTYTIQPWISWDDTHYNFKRIGQFPSVMWRMDSTFESATEVARWSPVICAFIFFAFFGFAVEARKHYRLLASSVSKKMGVSTTSFGASLPGFLTSRSETSSLPVFGKHGTGSSGKLPTLDTQVSVTIDFDQEKLRSTTSDSSSITSVDSPAGPRPPMPFPVSSPAPAHQRDERRPSFTGDNAV